MSQLSEGNQLPLLKNVPEAQEFMWTFVEEKDLLNTQQSLYSSECNDN